MIEFVSYAAKYCMTPAERISYNTWHLLKRARALDTRLSEETLTDLLILDLKGQETTYRIRVFQTTKREEARIGTDMEVVVRAGGTDAWRYAIQAKKLFRNGYYDIMKGTGNPKRLQVSVLETYARNRPAIPCYLLYNQVDLSPCSKPQSPYWNCCQCCDTPQFGCTLVPSWVVRAAIHSGPAYRKFDTIHEMGCAMPFRCLFDCSNGPLPHSNLCTSPSLLHGEERSRSWVLPSVDYSWIPTEPIAGAWPERLPRVTVDEETDFTQRYFRSQEHIHDFLPRRLVLIDPESYRSRWRKGDDG